MFNNFIFQCLNKDGVIITLDVTYQYRAQIPKLYDITMDFKDFDGYKKVLQFAGKLHSGSLAGSWVDSSCRLHH